MQIDYEERIDNIEVMLGRLILESDRAQRRQEQSLTKLEELITRNEKRAEEDRIRAEADRKNWNKKWGELSDKLGTIVEDIVAPNIPRIAKELCHCDEIDDIMIRRWVRNKKDRSKRREFDVIAVCGEYVIINETKSTIRIDYINRFIETLPDIPDYFPEYENKTIIPIFSSLSIREDMVNYLTKHHIYAMAMGEETMVLLNNQSW